MIAIHCEPYAESMRFPSNCMTRMKRTRSDIRATATLIVAVLPILIIVAATGCGGGGADEKIRFGRSLELHVSEPELVDRMALIDGQGQLRLLLPKATNRQLALVNLTVVNRSSVVIPMLIDSQAVQLGTRRGDKIDAVDPFETARVATEPGPDENKFQPLLWGDVDLARNFQITGWLVFDVPKGLTLGSLFWNEVDSIIVDLVDFGRG